MIELASTIARYPLPVFGGMLVVILMVVTGAVRFVHTSPPPRRFARERVIAALVVVMAIVVFGVLAAGVHGATRSVAFDEALATSLAHQSSQQSLQESLQPSSSRFDALVAGVTHLGDRATLIAVVVAIGASFVASRRFGYALAWVLTCAGNGVLNPALKSAFARARPVHDAAYATVGEYSFPSGHTSGSVVVYGMLAYLASRLVATRWHLPIVLVAAALVFTVGCSRIYLRVHWASDVIAGLASGAAWLTLCIVITEHVRARRAALSPR